MKTLKLIVPTLATCCACISNPIVSTHEGATKENSPLKTWLTKSGTTTIQEDSITVMNRTQKDVNHLMMNRIILKDTTYILAIKRQDAIFLGVSEETYNRYVEYVEQLNNKL